MSDELIPANIAQIRDRARRAAQSCGRDPAAVTVLAAAKAQPAAAIRAAAAAGIRHIGENYLQEALGKMEALADLPLVWHFIGAIQSNKTRKIAAHFDWAHTVARPAIARRLGEQRPSSRPPLNVCLQVNISGEASKAGAAPGELEELAAAVAAQPGLRLRGLMAIPAPGAARSAFAEVGRLFEELQADYPEMDTLSMGMSADLEAAIAEGATILRIGEGIFGPRPRRA